VRHGLHFVEVQADGRHVLEGHTDFAAHDGLLIS
jgi:hypothetical protein